MVIILFVDDKIFEDDLEVKFIIRSNVNIIDYFIDVLVN